ncbi:MAG: YtxH domain-containing protein [candidate division KSB1 bacterium]|nr:YtxH domain-containing protein [candidate division KSB1 bacterium]MDZ7302585.1 YtxH domain-containing protein [candidate division KSB1 bacterium]MDZ7311574.1 YtxH domain-containing protein [candidate division KSB1 bacterium]
MSQENRGADFLKGILVGGAIGAVIALLFAPKSGTELRADIRRKSKELYDETETSLGDLKKQAAEIVEQGKRQAEALRAQAEAKIKEARAKAEQLISEGRAKARELVEEGAKTIEREKGRIRSAVDAGVKAYREEVEGTKSQA